MAKGISGSIRKIDYVLLKLADLLKKWDIAIEDWMMIGQYPYMLLGYNTPLREGHFNILVRKEKVPWDFDSRAVEIHPPVNSSFADDYEQFAAETGYNFDLVPFPKDQFSDWLTHSINYQIAQNKEIHIQSERGAIKEYSFLLPLLCSREGYGPEKGRRILQNIAIYRDEFRLQGKHEESSGLTKLLDKYSSLVEKAEISPSINDVNQLNGTSASNGLATGKVRVIIRTKKKKPLVNDEILVTKMTSPEFLTIIGKARAIVTDEGGILCHAAILARELSIPCVVGTGNATKRLKDGDLIEVNATKGTIKILKRKRGK